MRIQTFASLASSGRLGLLMKVTGLFKPFYRLTYVASAASCGLLGFMGVEPRTLEEIAHALNPDLPPEHRGSLSAWLALGVRLGTLKRQGDRYALKSMLARRLAELDNDDVAALAEEVVTMHHRMIFETPKMLQKGERWTMANQDGATIARSSRIMSPFIFQTIDWAMPKRPNLKLLEAGCGSGVYIRYALERNSSLSVVGLEYQSEVAEATRAELCADFPEQVRVECADVRAYEPGEGFDVVTLYNSIYYFPLEDRVPLLRKLAGHLREGGRLILSTSCRGGSPGMQVLDLWSSSTEGCGPLPDPEEMQGMLLEAGFGRVEARRVIPGEEYFAFVAEVGAERKGTS